MNLLVITNNPQNASFRQRIEQYLPGWKREGIECEIAHLPRMPFARWRLFSHAGEFDGVLLHKKMMNPWDAHFLRRSSRWIAYDFDDAIMYKPEAADRDDRRRLRAFRRTVHLADLVIAGNAYLAEHARAYTSNVQIIPTALDTKTYAGQARPAPDGTIRLVWIGGKATLAYLRQISPALEQTGDRFPNVAIRIVCNTFFELRHLRVERRQWSLHEQTTDLVSSDIGLAPLPDNRYTRGKCGFKILQYAAAGLPTVASPVGVNTQYVQHGVTGFHATTVSEWVDTMAQLIRDEQLRAKMGQAARAGANDYDSSNVGRRLVAILKQHITGRDAPAER